MLKIGLKIMSVFIIVYAVFLYVAGKVVIDLGGISNSFQVSIGYGINMSIGLMVLVFMILSGVLGIIGRSRGICVIVAIMLCIVTVMWLGSSLINMKMRGTSHSLGFFSLEIIALIMALIYGFLSIHVNKKEGE